jgi:hypothetical protein
MKSILKFIPVLLCLQFFAVSTFAQTQNEVPAHANKTYFTGIWELAQIGQQRGQLQNVNPGYLKIFNTDGTFANIQGRNTGSVISHSGQFVVNTATEYTEFATYRMTGMTGGALGKGFKLTYEFSVDKKYITISYTLESGEAFTEVWRRL